MTELDFVKFMQHFIENVRPSVEHPVLLLLDNHGSHMSVEALSMAKKSGVIMLSFPPHCSHKLQPLDRSVYGPFKKYFNSACDAFMQNKAATISIYDIPGLVKTALPHAITPSNIMSGFQVSGVMPTNRHIFDGDFDLNFFTDKPVPPTAQPADEIVVEAAEDGTFPDFLDELGTIEDPVLAEILPADAPATKDSTLSTTPGPSNASPPSSSSSASSVLEKIRPYPKAASKSSKITARKVVKSAILTSTPVKSAIEANKIRTAAARKIYPEDEVAPVRRGRPRKTSQKPTVSKKNPHPRKKQKVSKSNEEDREWFCQVCQEPYSTSQSSWVKCRNCDEWSHEKCVDDPVRHLCDSCNSVL